MGIPFDRLGSLFSRWGHRAYPRWAWPLLSEALRTLPREGRVLDLGGGTGVLARAALAIRPDLKITVVDPAKGMLRHVPAPIEVAFARAEALPFARAQLDAVLLGEALHHFQDPRAALVQVARVLRPGGLLWIYDFDPRAGLGRWVYWGERLLGEPANFMTPQGLLGEIAGLGFSGSFEARRGRYVLTARLKDEKPQAAARPA